MNTIFEYTDILTRTGYTIVDGVKIVQYTCAIPMNNPSDMRISSTRLKPELYKIHRDICRKDLATFEDSAYELQEKYLSKVDM